MVPKFLQGFAAVWMVFLSGFLATASTNVHVVLITVDGFPAYLLADPQAPLPTFRKLARDGAVAEGMKVSNPSITWPNHTTLVTGMSADRHSVLFNGVLVRPGPGFPVRVDPRRDKSDLVAVPTIYDHLHKAGYKTAGINWPCTRNAPTLGDDFPDVPDQVTHTTPRLRAELIKTEVFKDETDRSFTAQSAASKDQIWTAAAVHVIKQRKPNLLLFHMLITDSTHHRYGPQSPAGYTALAQADAQLRDILRALDEAGIRERTTLFITSDHGFAIATNVLNPNVLFRKAGLLETTNAQIARAKAQSVAEGGTALVYFTNPDSAAEDRIKVVALLERAEGIAEIITPERFPTLGLPDPSKNRQMGELVLVAKDGYAFGNAASSDNYVTQATLITGSVGQHGLLSTNPKMNAAFIAAGRGIKRGTKLGLIENTSVAPTIMKLLGQPLPESSGKILGEMLSAE